MTDDELQEVVKSQIKAALAPQKPRFDPTITLGSLLTICTMLVGGFGVYVSTHDTIRDTQREANSNTKSIAELKEVTQAIMRSDAARDATMEKLTWIVDSIQKDKKP